MLRFERLQPFGGVMTIDPKLRALIQAVIDSADSKHCSYGKAITSKVAIDALECVAGRMSQQAFVEGEGYACPYCRSEDVNYPDDPLVTGGTITHYCTCPNCKKGWREIYKLSGYEENV
jgi:hypothetical protein